MTNESYLVVVGSYAEADKPGIYAFAFDAAAGTLTPRGSYAGVVNPSFVIVHPDGQWLYAVSETDARGGAPGSVWALRMDREPWSLAPINQQISGGDWPCHLELDPSGRWLLVSNYGSGTVGVLPIREDGSLGALADLIRHHGSGPNAARQEGPHAHSAAFTPDGRFAIVADLGLDQLLLYALDQSTGKLGARGHADAPPGAGPRHIAFDASGKRMYVANEMGSSVVVYDYDSSSGAPRELQIVGTLPEGAPHNDVADIHLAPDGARLYVSNRGHDSIAVFDVGADGLLARVATPSCGGTWPRNFAVAPGGWFLLVANQHSGEVSVLPALDGPEALGAPVERAAVPGASCVKFVGLL